MANGIILKHGMPRWIIKRITLFEYIKFTQNNRIYPHKISVLVTPLEKFNLYKTIKKLIKKIVMQMQPEYG